MVISETATASLTETQWQVAHAIAYKLVQQNTDVSELRKVITYLRTTVTQNPSHAEQKFFQYLQTLVSDGKSIFKRSHETLRYYYNINDACSLYFQNMPLDAESMLQILTWVYRLMYYYKAEPETEPSPIKIPVPVASKIPELEIGQEIEAEVVKIQSNKVTYELNLSSTTKPLTNKEPKYYESLVIGQKVTVIITELKNGIPNKVKYVLPS